MENDEYQLVDSDFEKPRVTFNENTFQQKNKNQGNFIRYSEGRAKITIKREKV
jgi:hypothetical protein